MVYEYVILKSLTILYVTYSDLILYLRSKQNIMTFISCIILSPVARFVSTTAVVGLKRGNKDNETNREADRSGYFFVIS